MGYSLAHTNNLAAQNAEMILFVRKTANVSTEALIKLKTVGWKVRIEDDLVFQGVDVQQIREWHRWNLNKLRFWSWTEYTQILFLDSDTIVKGDLSEVWNTPGGPFLSLVV
jgi:alpha-N-acetylglucosamine transferase